MILIDTHNILFNGEILKLSLFIILIPTPDILGANLGSLLYGDVPVMCSRNAELILFAMEYIKALNESSLRIALHKNRNQQ